MPSRETISLYYRAGTSDKVYNVQLEPSGSGWLVNVQYGRRTGSALREETKTATPVGYSTAKATYDDLVDAKKKKGYSAGALSGKSAAPAPASAPAAPLKLPALPDWEGFEEFYVDAATALGEPSTLRTAPQPHLVLLADISSGMQDGTADAIASIKRLKNASDIRGLLSKEGRAWMDALDTALQATCGAALLGACKRAS